MDTKSRPILVVSKGFPPDLGGIETYTEQVAKAYLAAGYPTYVITQFHGPQGWQQRSDNLKVFNTGTGLQALQLFRFNQAIRRISRDAGPFAAIHATTWRTALPVLIARAKGPLCITVHGREVAAQRWPFTALARAVLARAHRIIIISAEARRRCSTVAPVLNTAKTVVSWNGISPPPTQPRSSNETPVVLTACRLTAFKNVMGVLEAAAILNNRPTCPPFNMIIAGDGPEGDVLRAFAKANSLNNVQFLGTVPRIEMPALLSSADIFLHPQISIDSGRGFESFCLAVADAMAAGLPTIAGLDGAPAEYIHSGISGIIVDGKSSPSIADALQDLLSNPAKRTSIGKQAAIFANGNFAWAKHVAPVIDVSQESPAP